MKTRKTNRRLLRIRPGHLANFSNAAAYLPFIVFFTVPASVVFGFFGSLILYFRGKHLLARGKGTKTGLYEFVRFARWHTLICIIIAGVSSMYFIWTSFIYREGYYDLIPLALILTAGPFAAYILSSLVLILLMQTGPKWIYLPIAWLAHLLLIFLPFMLISAITGAD